MWVIMASAVVFGGATTGMLRGSEYIERKNPRNKLIWEGTEVGAELLPTTMTAPIAQGNRHQRRGSAKNIAIQTLASNQLSPNVNRQIVWCNIGVKVVNKATFPISCYVQFSETQIDGMTPPRATFPRDKMSILPGNFVIFRDDPIQMNGSPAGRLAGKMDFWIKYGLPGKETFDLRLKGNLDVSMEPWGLIMGVVRWRRVDLRDELQRRFGVALHERSVGKV
jgi:hypothetical protein